MAVHQPLYRLVRLYETNGSVLCRHYDVASARGAILWLGGVGGGFDSPARDLFDRLAVSLLLERIASLRLRYRLATDLDGSVEDALVALEFLGQRGIETIAVVGHALGGAVAIQAGAASLRVAGVVALASQSFGTAGANRIAPRPLLLVHGERDDVLPPECSAYIYENALEPKRLILLPGAGHCFDECEVELRDILSTWLVDQVFTPE